MSVDANWGFEGPHVLATEALAVIATTISASGGSSGVGRLSMRLSRVREALRFLQAGSRAEAAETKEAFLTLNFIGGVEILAVIDALQGEEILTVISLLKTKEALVASEILKTIKIFSISNFNLVDETLGDLEALQGVEVFSILNLFLGSEFLAGFDLFKGLKILIVPQFSLITEILVILKSPKIVKL